MVQDIERCGLEYIDAKVLLKDNGSARRRLFRVHEVHLCYGCGLCGLSTEIPYDGINILGPNVRGLIDATKDRLREDSLLPEGVVASIRARTVVRECKQFPLEDNPESSKV